MKIIEPSVKIIDEINAERVLKKLEMCGRLCYMSENSDTLGGAERFVGNLIAHGHMSPIEHEGFSVLFTTSRAIANQIVRHRLASYSQESTRYCRYDEIEAVIPPDLTRGTPEFNDWKLRMEAAEIDYRDQLKAGRKPQGARGVLPLDLATRLVMTANMREWRHFVQLRTSKPADPGIRLLAEGVREQATAAGLGVIFQ